MILARYCIAFLVGLALVGGCAANSAAGAAGVPATALRILRTGFENRWSAPLGPDTAVVARSQAAWDSAWRALGLPDMPPVVDFSREVAVAKATTYGSSPMGYESHIDSVRAESTGRVLVVFMTVDASMVVVDTSSRKVVAAAVRRPGRDSRWPSVIQWRVARRH
jgi:hypothetical protein